MQSPLFDDVIESVLAPLIATDDWRALAALLVQQPRLLLACSKPRVVFLKNCAIRHVLNGYLHCVERGETAQQTTFVTLSKDDVWRLLLNMSASRERHSLCLRCLRLFDAVTCIKHLREYMLTMHGDDVMRTVMQEKLRVMYILFEVCKC